MYLIHQRSSALSIFWDPSKILKVDTKVSLSTASFPFLVTSSSLWVDNQFGQLAQDELHLLHPLNSIKWFLEIQIHPFIIFSLPLRRTLLQLSNSPISIFTHSRTCSSDDFGANRGQSRRHAAPLVQHGQLKPASRHQVDGERQKAAERHQQQGRVS